MNEKAKIEPTLEIPINNVFSAAGESKRSQDSYFSTTGDCHVFKSDDLVMNEDRFERCLQEYSNILFCKYGWITALTYTVTTLISLLTGNFQGKELIQAFFVVFTVIAFLAFCFLAYKTYKNLSPREFINNKIKENKKKD